MNKRLSLLMALLFIKSIDLYSQVQWYQNQDGPNTYPNGTVGTSVQTLNKTSFIATYIWSMENDQYNWKLSKTRNDGTEVRTLFINGTTCMVETRIGRNAIYVLKKDYPFGLDPQYILYKLDTNLIVRSQRTIQFTGGYSVFNLNAFRIDGNDNLYIAGDGQYPDGPGYMPASFIMKADRNLTTSWLKMDSTQTSFTSVLVDDNGQVYVIQDHYEFFPVLPISKYGPNGQLKWKKNVTLNSGRFSLTAMLDKSGNIILSGGQVNFNGYQNVYFWKVSSSNASVIYKKDHFYSAGVQLTDIKQDDQGNMYTLVVQYSQEGQQTSRIGRVKANNGQLHWSRGFTYAHDSCNLFRLVVSDNEHIYAIGEKKRNDIYSRGFIIKMKNSGQLDDEFVAPDSSQYRRSHWLSDGITDRNDDLISIGSTQDYDPETYSSTYLRSFAVKFGKRKNNQHCDDDRGHTIPVSQASIAENAVRRFVIYPNPVNTEMNISHIDNESFTHAIIYNLQGKELLRQRIGSSSLHIDVRKLAGGTYFLVLNGKKKQTTSFVINR